MRFSLVIPVALYRDAEILKSLEKLDFPKEEYEIIVKPGPNPSENRNKGVEESIGDIVVFLDDDAVAHEAILRNADKFFNEHPEINIVGGPQLTPGDEKGFAKISGYALCSKFGGWSTSNRYGSKELNLDVDNTYLTTAIMFCKKEVFDKIRFDETLFPGEDTKFIISAKKEGMRIAYHPGLIVYHRRRPTIKAFVKQIFNYGKVVPLWQSPREAMKKPFFLIPSVFLLYLIVLLGGIIVNPGLAKYFFGIFSKDFSIASILFIPLLLYLVLNLISSFYESLKNKDLRGIIFLPFIFLLLHLTYGAGVIYGYAKD